MVFHNPEHQSHSDVKVSSNKDLWHANFAFVFFDASEIVDLDGNV